MSNLLIDSVTKPILTKRTNYRWVVMGIIFVMFTISFADRANIGTLLPVITTEFSLSNFEAGALASFFFLGYLIVQIPAGLWAGKYGSRGLVALAIFGFSCFTYLIGTATTALHFMVYRFGLGLSEGPSPIGGTSTIQNWFPPREKAIATGIYIGATQFAPIFVVPLCVWIMLEFGWRSVFYFFAIPGFLIAIIWYLFVRNNPEESPYCSPAEVEYIQDSTSVQEVSSREEVSLGWLDRIIKVKYFPLLGTNREVFRSWIFWKLTISYSLMVGVIFGLMTWIPSYLVSAKHYSYIKMGFMGAAPWVGGLAGSLLGGWLSDKVFLKRRKPLMLVTTVMTAVMMALLINAPGDTLILGTYLFLTGFLLYLGYPLFTTYLMDVTTGTTYPVAFGVMNTLANVFNFFTPMIAGSLIDAFNYGAVFIFFCIYSLISFCIVLTLNDRIHHEEDNHSGENSVLE